MTNQIEILDQKRRKYLRGYLVGFVIFFFTWLLRFFLRANEIGSTPVHAVIMAILIITVLVQAYFAIPLNLVKKKIKSDPKLYSALYNELVRLHELKAWRVAFLSVIAFLVVIGIVSFFMPVRDIIFVVLTAILAGSFGYHSSFYYLDRS